MIKIGFFDKINYSMIVNAFKQVCIVVTRVGVCVCLSVRGRMPALLHDGPGCNPGGVVGDAP